MAKPIMCVEFGYGIFIPMTFAMGSETPFSDAIDLFARLFGDHSSHCALLNADSKILAVNRSWRTFGLANGLEQGYQFEGQDYLNICEEAAGRNSEFANEALSGLLSMILSERRSFAMYYPCHSPTEPRWFTMWAQSQVPQSPLIVVAHTYVGPELNAAMLARDQLMTRLN